MNSIQEPQNNFARSYNGKNSNNRNIKQEILDATNGGFDIFKKIFLQFGEDISRKRTGLKNPFYPDRNGSVEIKRSKRDNYYYEDFGHSPNNLKYKGDCFDFASQYFKRDIKTEFFELLKDIIKEFNLKIDLNSTNPKKIQNNYNPAFQSFTESDLKYFAQYEIKKETLIKFKVRSILKYKIGKKTIASGENSPIFAYTLDVGYKIYRPFENKYKFFYFPIGSKPKIFGLEQCSLEENHIILTGGEKDVMTLHSLGYNAFCLNSETADLEQTLVDELKQKFTNIFILYDIDETGKARAKELEQLYNINSILLPNDLLEYKCKDISDWVKLANTNKESSFSIDDIRNHINNNIYIDDNDDDSTFNNFPILYKSINSNLPNVLSDLMDLYKNERQKDMLLLELITTISCILPNVKSKYSNSDIFPNLYLIIVAPAGSGKSTLRKMDYVLEPIDKYIKGLDPANKLKGIIIPADNSKAGFIQLLALNEGKGLIIETEIDSLASSFKQEWGDFSEVLRKAFHNETINKFRITEKEKIEIKNPKLSVILTGTFNQLKKVIPNTEDGLYSRFIIYLFNDKPNWESQFLINDIDLKFKALGEFLLDLYKYLEGQEIEMTLNKNQQSIFDSNLEKMLNECNTTAGKEYSSNVKRLGDITIKLMMILEILFLFENNELKNKNGKVEISDKTFNMVMLIITILNKIKLWSYKLYPQIESTKIDESKKSLTSMEHFLENLPIEFEKQLFIELAEKYKISKNEQTKLLYKSKIFERINHGVYRKSV